MRLDIFRQIFNNKKMLTRKETIGTRRICHSNIKNNIENNTKNDPRSKLPATISTGGKDGTEFTNGENHVFESGDLIQVGWKERHASISEAIVKAERHVSKNPQELQKDSVEHFTKFNSENIKRENLKICEIKSK